MLECNSLQQNFGLQQKKKKDQELFLYFNDITCLICEILKEICGLKCILLEAEKAIWLEENSLLTCLWSLFYILCKSQITKNALLSKVYEIFITWY